MTTLTLPAAPSSATRQLAEDLGLVLDALLERTATGFVERGGARAAIGALADIAGLVAGTAGTQVSQPHR